MICSSAFHRIGFTLVTTIQAPSPPCPPQAPKAPCPPLKFLPPPVVDALITSICRQIGPNGRQGSNQAQSRTRTKWQARQQATNSPNLSNFEPHSFFLTLAPMPIRGLDSEDTQICFLRMFSVWALSTFLCPGWKMYIVCNWVHSFRNGMVKTP